MKRRQRYVVVEFEIDVSTLSEVEYWAKEDGITVDEWVTQAIQEKLNRIDGNNLSERESSRQGSNDANPSRNISQRTAGIFKHNGSVLSAEELREAAADAIVEEVVARSN